MDIPVSEAKAQLSDLVRRAGEGEDIVLTRHGRPIARLRPASERVLLDPEERVAFIHELYARVRARGLPSIDAARGQDFLYDDDGLPA